MKVYIVIRKISFFGEDSETIDEVYNSLHKAQEYISCQKEPTDHTEEFEIIEKEAK